MSKSTWLFISCLLVGLAVIFLTKPLAAEFSFSNGKQLVAYYFALPLSIFYFMAVTYLRGPQKFSFWLALLLFFLLMIPFGDSFLKTYAYLEQDDGFRYRVVATNIAMNQNLWGSDDLIYGTDTRTYMIQPGYRYYLAAWIFLFGEENRLFQFFNMFVYLIAVLMLLKKMERISIGALFRKGFTLFILLSSFFVVKLILMGLSEWLAVTLFILSVCSWFSSSLTLAAILLALIPFLRQNLLLFSFFVFAWMVVKEKRKWLFISLYSSILLLPLYHNLYYAGKWKFFSTYTNTETFLVLDFEGSYLSKIVKTVLYHVSLYGGINWRLDNHFANILAVTFIPLGTFLMMYAYFQLKAGARIWFLLITLSAIVPTLIIGGTAYYPRFEWVNLCLAALAYILLHNQKNSRKEQLTALH